MTVSYQITKLPGCIEAAATLQWYATAGSYRISVIGTGKTEDEARTTASLMLGQARAALHVAMIEGVHRVPEATETTGAG